MLAARSFETYGPSHLTVLAIFAVGVVLVVLAGRRLAGTVSEQPLRRALAVAILAVAGSLQVLQFTPDEWNWQTSLPLQLCDLGWMLAVYALWTRNRLCATITYLWGITLTTQGIFTPDLESEFPELRFLMFWGMHLLVVWAAFLVVPGLRILPTWHNYRQTLAITLVWAVVVFVFNVIADTNYGYLNRLPKSSSLLDFLGPWPLYVVLEIAIVAVVWALLTWPWALKTAESPEGRRVP
jgi:hypothetical integral membrane protein (TIGR02206 family)